MSMHRWPVCRAVEATKGHLPRLLQEANQYVDNVPSVNRKVQFSALHSRMTPQRRYVFSLPRPTLQVSSIGSGLFTSVDDGQRLLDRS